MSHASAAETPKPHSTPCKGILVVEDDADIRFALEQILELEGYRVFSAANGHEGMQLLQTSERPCLILLDLMMPLMNGWQFMEVQRIDTRISTIPTIVVSAAGDCVQRTTANGYLKKPIDISSLLETVRLYCG